MNEPLAELDALDRRITAVEELLMHFENKLEALDEVVRRQQGQLAALDEQLRRSTLAWEATARDGVTERRLEDEKPPHY